MFDSQSESVVHSSSLDVVGEAVGADVTANVKTAKNQYLPGLGVGDADGGEGPAGLEVGGFTGEGVGRTGAGVGGAGITGPIVGDTGEGVGLGVKSPSYLQLGRAVTS